jgi:hypothetical protein
MTLSGIVELFGYFLTLTFFWASLLGVLVRANFVTLLIELLGLALGVFCLWYGRASARPLDGKTQSSLCQFCGSAGPIKKLEFRRRMGVIIVNIHQTKDGYFCQQCADSTFRSYLPYTLALGWWSISGFLTNHIILLNNVINFIDSRLTNTQSQSTEFVRLSSGWNAELDDPFPVAQEQGTDLILAFVINPMMSPKFKRGDICKVTFKNCWRYRLGHPNREEWRQGQCRFSRRAPSWGEFYQVSGNLLLSECPEDWKIMGPASLRSRHFLFYFRDSTFECDAEDWTFDLEKQNTPNS